MEDGEMSEIASAVGQHQQQVREREKARKAAAYEAQQQAAVDKNAADEAAADEAKKKRDAELAAAEDEAKRKRTRYGSGAVPMTEYLGTAQSGVRKTLLGG
jgi:hypothetical protein